MVAVPLRETVITDDRSVAERENPVQRRVGGGGRSRVTSWG